jgi:hypothetical protein
MKTFLITVLVTVLLLAGGLAVVYRMPAPEVTASKYILHIDPSGPAGAASADRSTRSIAPLSSSGIPASLPQSDTTAQYDQTIRQQSGLGSPDAASDGAGAERATMARRQEMPVAPASADTPRGTVSPWDAAFNSAASGPASASPADTSSPPADTGQKTADRLTPGTRRIQAPAEAVPAAPAAQPWAMDDRPAATEAPNQATTLLEPSPAGTSAPAPSSPASVSSAASATESPPGRFASNNEAQPAANSWLTQQSASAPVKPIPPMPRRRADQLPPIPRGGAAAAAPVMATPAGAQ